MHLKTFLKSTNNIDLINSSIGMVIINSFCHTNNEVQHIYKLRDILIWPFILQCPANQVDFAFCFDMKNCFKTIIYICYITFEFFECEHLIFIIYSFKYLFGNLLFPICSEKKEEMEMRKLELSTRPSNDILSQS